MSSNMEKNDSQKPGHSVFPPEQFSRVGPSQSFAQFLEGGK